LVKVEQKSDKFKQMSQIKRRKKKLTMIQEKEDDEDAEVEEK